VPATAGADRVVEKLLENFSRDNDYWIYVRADGESMNLGRDNLHLIPISSPRGKHIGAFFFFFFSSLHFLFKGHCKLAHIHNSDFGIFTLFVRLKPGTMVLGTFHGDPYVREKWGRFARFYLRISERFFVVFCNRLTSVSKFKSRVKGVWRDVDAEYIPNGVDPYRLEDDLELPVEIASLGEYIFFACGRLDSTKGLHTLLAAYALLPSKPRLLVVGDFGHDPGYSRQIDEMIAGDEKITAYRGLLPRSQLMKTLSDCRFFVFPSEYEAMSMMLLEAVSCNAPVICTDIPPNMEVMGQDYEYAFPVADENGLADKMAKAMADERWPKITEDLYARCTERFGWQNIARQYELLYEELAK
jgi:glycosyltransferase involved in cell wall biosynthesis